MVAIHFCVVSTFAFSSGALVSPCTGPTSDRPWGVWRLGVVSGGLRLRAFGKMLWGLWETSGSRGRREEATGHPGKRAGPSWRIRRLALSKEPLALGPGGLCGPRQALTPQQALQTLTAIGLAGPPMAKEAHGGEAPRAFSTSFTRGGRSLASTNGSVLVRESQARPAPLSPQCSALSRALPSAGCRCTRAEDCDEGVPGWQHGEKAGRL